jgi:hypothetical protein
MHARGLLTLPYRVARTPLDLLDAPVLNRLLPRDSRPRLVFDRTVGTVDELAGRLLHDGGIRERGRARIERASGPGRAAPPQPPAEVTRDPAKRRTRAKATPEARTARARATKAKQHDDGRANHTVDTIRQNLRETEAIAEAREHQAGEPAPGGPDGK